jgi:hypothetical protein
MLLAFLVSACASIGPSTLPRDRVNYLEALSESWKEQTLLNVVRLRYGDAPTFLEIASIVSSYGVQTQVSAGGQINADRTATVPGASATIGANASFLDRPTISYTPLVGDRFTRSLLTPIPPTAVFQLIQAGYPADFVLQVTTRALNGVFNRSGIGGRTRQADPEFYPILDAMRRLQLSGAVSLRLERRGKDDTVLRLVLSNKRSSGTDDDIRFLRQALGVAPDAAGELTVTFGAVPKHGAEFAILTRSMMEILLEVALGIEVPQGHLAEGRTASSSRDASASDARDRPFVRVLSSSSRPPEPFVAVQQYGTWFWIDERDYASKRAFSILMLFFSLAEAGGQGTAPVLTLPVN